MRDQYSLLQEKYKLCTEATAPGVTPEKLQMIIRNNFENNSVDRVQIITHYGDMPCEPVEVYLHEGTLYIGIIVPEGV